MPLATDPHAPPISVTEAFYRASRDTRPVVLKLLEKGAESLDWIDDLRQLQQDLTRNSPYAADRACSAGCASCCFTVQVDVTPIEAIAVADYLRTCLDAPALKSIRERLGKLTQRRRAGDYSRRLACGMLGSDGECQVYPIRPIVCSGVFSLDRQACELAAEAIAAGNPSKSIPLDKEAIQATGGIAGSLQRVLVEHGLDGNLYELNSAVLCALQYPDALKRFRDGEDLFAEAICTEAHSPPRVARVPKPHFRLPARRKRA